MSAITDPVADLLTRLRNASRAGHEQVEIPGSNLKLQIVKILAQEKFIRGYQYYQDGPQATLRVYLKYGDKHQPVLTQLQRVSRPGRRQYAAAQEISRVQSGLGIAILSTSQGVLTDRDCRRLNVGGEVLCHVW
ncbi:MAG: 30S ribosomal protein S8 [Armatimonadetes bacterium]|nr:30S ribosomal protein S8 [Armatimonadota bacterium]